MLCHYTVIQVVVLQVVVLLEDLIAHLDDSAQVHHLDEDFLLDEVEVEVDEVDGKK
jgi:hypothetical protein